MGNSSSPGILLRILGVYVIWITILTAPAVSADFVEITNRTIWIDFDNNSTVCTEMVVENAKTHIPINGRYQPLGGQCDKDTFVFKMKEESVIINPYYLKVLRNQNVKTQTYIISSDNVCDTANVHARKLPNSEVWTERDGAAYVDNEEMRLRCLSGGPPSSASSLLLMLATSLLAVASIFHSGHTVL